MASAASFYDLKAEKPKGSIDFKVRSLLRIRYSVRER
jgi:hypothetical protein